ncbi:3'-5' exonuclease eri1 [Vanrija pseudolonga]|uniref:3'-5' exonuclease eri1 n=1 Tax=Vanrija pseudolonga TaxID=143232 RepID=A0AAF0YDI6_9TREE|nr:3'-5' exonuclease eri1 [Vanrija pseudolonga]
MTATTTGEAPCLPSDPPAPFTTNTTTTAEATAPDPPPSTADSTSQSSSPPPIERPRKKATASEMRASLEQLGLDTRGKRETLWKRLFTAFSRAKEDSEAAEAEAAAASRKTPPPKQPWGSFLCFDVEATCEQGKNFDYPNEIIEFPVVLLRWEEDADGGRARLVTVDTFHTYVRPTWRPVLSDFCSSLTGITQEVIDAAPTFPEVLRLLEAWLDKWDLRLGDGDGEGHGLKDALWVTDGPWDLRDFIPKQLHITPTTPAYPGYLLGPYLNLKAGVEVVLMESARREKDTSSSSSPKRSLPRLTTAMRRPPTNAAGPTYHLPIPGQLKALGLGTFSGRQHSGIDDATNIARILAELAARHVVLDANARLPPAKGYRRWPWMGKPGEVIWDAPAAPVLGVKVALGAPAPVAGADAAPPAEAADRTPDIAGLMDRLALGADDTPCAAPTPDPKPNL